MHVRVLVGIRWLSRSTSYPSDRQASTGGDYRHLTYITKLNGAEVSSCTLWLAGASRVQSWALVLWSPCLFLWDVVFVACLGLDLRGWVSIQSSWDFGLVFIERLVWKFVHPSFLFLFLWFLLSRFQLRSSWFELKLAVFSKDGLSISGLAKPGTLWNRVSQKLYINKILLMTV